MNEPNYQAGDRVRIAPEWDGDDTLYVIVEWNIDRGVITPLYWPHGVLRPQELATAAMIVPEHFSRPRIRKSRASERYLYQLRSDINRFKERFPGPILQIKSHEIDEWLRKLGGAPRTRNSSLTSIRTFFSWAKSRCYLPKNEETAAEGIPKVRVGDTETGVFTPEQMSKILEAASEEIIPFVVLGAFAGLRAAEITRIEWTAIDLERRFITIRAGQAKTASRRIVPISDNLRQWLLPHVGRGLVVPSAETYRKVTNLSRRLGIEWPHNVLRHSLISYRIAKIKNANEVALEAGNSPDIIFRHYRELATEEQADAWFAIVPPAES